MNVSLYNDTEDHADLKLRPSVTDVSSMCEKIINKARYYSVAIMYFSCNKKGRYIFLCILHILEGYARNFAWEELGRELDRDRKTFRVCICMLPRYQSCEHITFQKYSATSEYNRDKKIP